VLTTVASNATMAIDDISAAIKSHCFIRRRLKP
jgi:hypothetical protein